MRKQGFTLMELLVVIAILAILAGIGIPYMTGYRNRAAAGVNEVNRLTTQRQIAMVLDAFPEDMKDIPRGEEILAANGFLKLGDWEISAPSALAVTSGAYEVEAGTVMKVWLKGEKEIISKKYLKDETLVLTTYWEAEAKPSEAEETMAPTETVPQETEPPETDPTIPPHTCRDWNSDCRCDTEGCPEILHTEEKWVENGNCSKCGTHFLHRGMEDQVCDTCRLDEATGQTHVCSWAEGVCRCKCGSSRCDHGSTRTDTCPICGAYDYWMDPCPNCD